ncbi:MAG: serine/threonine-protein kinase [Gemmataceae bacterium]|nr:serine/threonine-protein kinase [Gemmata sp.]MDW8197527.1 serine/threonine-protein kinase [Gemmataceae bacterium]
MEFPGYEIVGELGRGGMGVVYQARQQKLNRMVALKVILGGPLASAEEKARFRIEAEAAARLHHPNIVQVYDVGEHAGFAYMALELVEGPTLRCWQNGRRLEPLVAARIVAKVARAIQHAHEHGIVHRDIKPANILLAPMSLPADVSAVASAAHYSVVTGVDRLQPSDAVGFPFTFIPKVTDFGLAKSLEGGSQLTITGVAYGTPNYMAPEQVRGHTVGVAVDVYALGAVLYELLTGQPPFVGSNPNDILNQILRTEPVPMGKLVPRLPQDLTVIVGKCLEKEPGRRYPSARELADDLDRFIQGQPIAARPISRTELIWRWTRRNPLVAVHLALTTIGFLVTTALAWGWAQSASEERRLRSLTMAAHAEAEQQRIAAETARDHLKEALHAAEMTRQLAEDERAKAAAAQMAAEQARESAHQQAAFAVEQKQQADAARAIAEAHLQIARSAIRTSLRELSRHPRFEDDEFRIARETLIKQVRAFRDAAIQHAPNTSEWLDDIADVSHWLGFLEYLNTNYDVAAREYRLAADAAGRWAKLEADNMQPRSRQADSLLNAGNALVLASQPTLAETCYRHAIAIVNDLVRQQPKAAVFRRQAVEIHGQLTHLYQLMNMPTAWETATRDQLLVAEELVAVCGRSLENLRWLATAQMNRAQVLARTAKWDEAEKALTQALTTREQIMNHPSADAQTVPEYAHALVVYGRFLNARDPQKAEAQIQKALAIFEEYSKTHADKTLATVELTKGYTHLAEFLRAQRKYTEAEKWYDQAITLTVGLLDRFPNHRPARETWAKAATGRAHLYNNTQRHHQAAQEWATLAARDPDFRIRPRHELFAIQSLVFAKDWKAARTAAEAQMTKNHPGWMWLDLGRVWCLIAQQITTDSELSGDDQHQGLHDALKQATLSLEKARSAGVFQNEEQLKWYYRQPEFALVRDQFDPLKK